MKFLDSMGVSKIHNLDVSKMLFERYNESLGDIFDALHSYIYYHGLKSVLETKVFIILYFIYLFTYFLFIYEYLPWITSSALMNCYQ